MLRSGTLVTFLPSFLLCFILFIPSVAFAVTVNIFDEIPDLVQTDPQGYLPGGGEQYCAPVSVANSFIWLSGNGYDNLMQGMREEKKAQFDLVRLLGSSSYMKTNKHTGTGVYSVLAGVSRFIRDRGYDSYSLSYQGWRVHPAEFGTGISVPELSWIVDGLSNDSAVWLNIGWYRYDEDSRVYTRRSGHWVTLVGYDDGDLIIHDPYPRNGSKVSSDYVSVSPLSSGQLKGKLSGLPRSSEGYLRLQGDSLPRSYIAILDGAIVLKMKINVPEAPVVAQN